MLVSPGKLMGPYSGEAVALDPFWANVVLLTHFNGANDSVVFPDESNASNALTAVGTNAKLKTANKVFGTASLYTDASSYVTIPDSASWNFGADPFTMEAQVYFADAGSGYSMLFGQYGSGDKVIGLFYDQVGGDLVIFTTTDGSSANSRAVSSWSMTPEQWYTIAIDRDAAGKYRIYVDGTMIGSETALETLYDGDAVFGIGASSTGGSQFNGNIDELRVTKGVARYASDSGYTPDTEEFPNDGPAVALDPFWNNVVLLSHFDGVNESEVFPDESDSAHVLTSNGSVCRLTTADKVFGTASLVTGTFDYATIPDSDDFHFGTEPFTIEGRFRFETVLSSFSCLLGKWESPNKEWALFYNDTTKELVMFVSVDGTTSLQRVHASQTILGDTWYAIAVDRDASNKYRIYVGGAMVGSETATDDIRNGTAVVGIGATGDGSTGWFGEVDELRITNGIARYASDGGYTIDTVAFPDS